MAFMCLDHMYISVEIVLLASRGQLRQAWLICWLTDLWFVFADG